ncbi:MAG: chromosome segregation protein SMC [Candidatus Sumerlaeia bacterium]|nr:chromosome segregation protein SMC [Candidatus Sumerlaeia bacterium]
MFFKRLEMVGFKSFATKTVLEFLPGITVIVGPNGCGKSNVFDAVRWALGEQRARSLRGQRMGDVIFSGSTSVKAQSMASVTLVINNEDRRLPIDFTEIQVARKLYKVGAEEYESEYYLNRTPCRLREITDLFMDTGVGTDSYSIMEQGQVDFIINARPNERRFLFDEAVGISKYRTRREEALRKLERAEADLVRLNDILSELKTRLRSLKIQANRAERYKQLVAEVRQLERNLLLLSYRELLAEKQRVDDQFDSLNAVVQGWIAQIAQLEQALLDKQVEMDALDRDIQSARSRRSETSAELERVQSHRAVLRERIETTEAQMRRDEAQIASLRQSREELIERRARLAGQIAEVAAELNRLDAEYQTRREQFEELLKTQSDARERLAALREQTRRAVEEKTRHENEHRIAGLMKQQALENLAQAQGQREQIAARRLALDERLAALQTHRAALAERIAHLQSEIERLEAVRRDHAEQLRALEQEKAATARARSDADSRRQALRSLQDNYEGYVRGVRELMNAAGRGDLAGVVGILPNCIESRPEDDLAIETALAGHLQDILVETEETALAGIELLRQGQLGRATFLPLDRIAPPPRDPLLTALVTREGVVGIAADLVRCEERLVRAVEAILGQTAIVETLETARTLRDEGYAVRFVARDGTVLAADGSISGGHVRATGLLGREREIRELGGQIALCDERLQQIEAQIAGQTSALEAAAAERESVQGRLAQARTELAAMDRDIERAAEDRTEALRALELAQREIERLQQKIAEYERAVEEHRQALDASDARNAELASQLAQSEQARESHDRQVALLQESLAQMLAQVSAARERHEAARQRLAEMDNELRRSDGQILQHQQQLESLAQTLDHAVAELDDSRQRHEELTAALAELDRQIAGQLAAREAAHDAVQQLQHEVHALQRQRNEQQNDLHEIDRRRAQCEVQIQNLNEQAQEKFHAPIAQLAEETSRVDKPREQIVAEIADLRGRIESMGEVNVIAIEEHRQLSERFDFLERQRLDLEEARTSLRKTIQTIDETSTERFNEGMASIREKFHETFRRLFGGGRADLILTEPDDVLNSGVEIVAQPPGKQPQSITLLSGGEKAMTAIALLFGIFLHRPSPFCVLDEIDAPLDDANIERFKDMVSEFSKNVQFIIITHNKQTMALADTLYGVTMEEPGVSRIVSVRFDQIEQTAFAG